MKKIVQRNSKILRKIAKEISLVDIGSLKTKKILGEMSHSLRSQNDGVAIAAPQIGYSLRIFVVSGKVFTKDTDKKNKKDLVFINPKISKLSREKEWLPEGCLSVRWLYGVVHRAKKATIVAYDERGKKFQRGASGLLAQIFQHEVDHLNGILFIDHAKNLREELPKQDK